ncbi:MAG: hypothetical protein FWC53_04250 [Firmicutes bacterium]|nr:hypothetical protein [Bacillota bacterium]
MKYVLLGILFAILYGLVTMDIYNAIVSGTVFAVFLAVFMGVLKRSQKKQFMKFKENLKENNEIIFGSAANYYTGKKVIGGWLILTKDKLFFKTYKNNIKIKEFAANLDSIDDIFKYSNLGVIPNGLRVVLKDGTTARFVVMDRRKWVKNLRKEEM